MLPQFILLAMMFVGLGMSMAKHGEPDKYNGWASLVTKLILLGLLWWGGFFDCFLS